MTTTTLRHTSAHLALAALAVLAGSSANAVEMGDRIDLHGYGYQDYAQASANSYIGADKKGTWDNNLVALVMSAKLNDQSKFWAQLEETSGGGTAVTWAFVDYDLSDSLRLHAGRVKFPLGFYNEIIDVKALQPAALEPSMYQLAADFVHDAYHGVGLDYEQDIGGGHALWQVYGGNVYDTDPPTTSRDRRMFGARVTYRTPLDGLTLMGSAYRTQVQTLPAGSMVNETRAIASIGYLDDAWDVKAEYAIHRFMGVKSDAWYVQAAYALTPNWKPYLRYDAAILDRSQRRDPSFYQTTAVVGIGYRVNSAIGLKLENHANRGYGLPVAEGSIAPGAGARTWNLTVLAADFQF